jgi:DNA-binding NtrC family response regulator
VGGVENIVDMTEQIRKDQELHLLRRQLKGKSSYHSIIGRHSSMQKIYEFVELAKNSTASVLISGESGTGKELVARAVHESSSRKKGPFVTVNCAALAESLLESELFGHVKGAFTDAIRDRKGRFEEAHNGTIFLDEIGDLPLSIQVKLLRVLQERVVERVGDNRPVTINARIIAATHSDLPELIGQRKFREDLFYRLNVIPVQIPPLRERKTDIPLLTEHFVEKNCRASGRCIVGCDPEAMALLMNYNWPGNVRELENSIEYAFVTCRDDTIRPENLPGLLLRPSARQGGDERMSIELALQSCGGRKAEASRMLGISRVTLWKKIRHYGLEQTRH